MVATTIPLISEEQMASRFLGEFPTPWTSAEAREPGGVLYALLFAFGNALQKQLINIDYDLKACRIETAINEALDYVAQDYFGDVSDFPSDVKRVPGEPDESLRARIKATLLLPAATRQSLIDLLKRLTGEEPRVMEPWNPMDTAVWGKQSFFNTDSKSNSSRFGNPGLRHQGFLESPLPSFANQGDFPVWCFNKGAAWGAPSAYFLKVQATWWMQVARIDALINKTKPFGTTVWRRYTGSPLTRNTLGGTLYLESGLSEYTVEVYPAFAGAFIVLANCNWNAVAPYQPIGTNKFKLTFSTETPAGAQVDWIATPISVGGVGTGPVIEDTIQATIGILPLYQDRVILAQPTWNTNFWLHSRSSSQAVLRFSTPAPRSAAISYHFFPANKTGTVVVSADNSTLVIPINSRDPFQAFVLPTWNTSVDIDKTPNQLILTFGTPPDADSLLYWGIHES